VNVRPFEKRIWLERNGTKNGGGLRGLVTGDQDSVDIDLLAFVLDGENDLDRFFRCPVEDLAADHRRGYPGVEVAAIRVELTEPPLGVAGPSPRIILADEIVHQREEIGSRYF